MKPIPGLEAANAARQEQGADRQTAALTEYFEAGDTTGATEEMLAAGRARLAHPDDTLAQLADRLGWTKDAYWGRLRRLLRLAAQARARAERRRWLA
jgi:DNA-binding transcriptional regulator WhiA